MTETAKNLVIENTEARLVTLPAVVSTDPRVAKGMELAPGENDVPAWYWEKCLKVQAVKIWEASGVLKNKGEGKAKPLMLGLDSLDRQDAFIKVAKCNEVRILKDWMEKSEKSEYKDMCKDRINELIKIEDDDKTNAG